MNNLNSLYNIRKHMSNQFPSIDGILLPKDHTKENFPNLVSSNLKISHISGTEQSVVDAARSYLDSLDISQPLPGIMYVDEFNDYVLSRPKSGAYLEILSVALDLLTRYAEDRSYLLKPYWDTVIAPKISDTVYLKDIEEKAKLYNIPVVSLD